jgi:hypothetical protein
MVNQLGGTPQEVFSDSLGEYTLGLILSPQIGRAKAILAAKGWAGDKMILWQGPRGHGVSLVTEWRDSKDAREFAHLFSVSAAQRYAVSIEPTVKNWQLSKGKITLRLAQGEKRVVLFFTSY